ncbi:MAG: hypothetical protein RBR08_08155 [Desulforegulaceae bacterium]|nr:hypothetical protein [Desulforegulaceae bacterium]
MKNKNSVKCQISDLCVHPVLKYGIEIINILSDEQIKYIFNCLKPDCISLAVLYLKLPDKIRMAIDSNLIDIKKKIIIHNIEILQSNRNQSDLSNEYEVEKLRLYKILINKWDKLLKCSFKSKYEFRNKNFLLENPSFYSDDPLYLSFEKSLERINNYIDKKINKRASNYAFSLSREKLCPKFFFKKELWIENTFTSFSENIFAEQALNYFKFIRTQNIAALNFLEIKKIFNYFNTKFFFMAGFCIFNGFDFADFLDDLEIIKKSELADYKIKLKVIQQGLLCIKNKSKKMEMIDVIDQIVNSNLKCKFQNYKFRKNYLPLICLDDCLENIIKDLVQLKITFENGNIDSKKFFSGFKYDDFLSKFIFDKDANEKNLFCLCENILKNLENKMNLFTLFLIYISKPDQTSFIEKAVRIYPSLKKIS